MEETQKLNGEAPAEAFSLVSQILETLKKEKASASDLAETLNVPVKQVYNAVSSLKRSDKIHVAEVMPTDRNTSVSIYAAGAAPVKVRAKAKSKAARAKVKAKSKAAAKKAKKGKVHKAKAPKDPWTLAMNTTEGVLLVLESGQATTEEIAQRLQASISNVHRVLRIGEKEGLFEKTALVGRSMAYGLTEAGLVQARLLIDAPAPPVFQDEEPKRQKKARVPRVGKIGPLFFEFIEIQKEIDLIQRALDQKTARRDEILALVDP